MSIAFLSRIILPRLCLLAALLLLSAACRTEQKLAVSDIVLEMTASDLQVGDTILELRALDQAGNPLAESGTLRLRGDMDHAGMIPVLAEAAAPLAGVYNVPFEWTMGGSWRVEASLSLSDDEVVRQEFHFDIASSSAEHTMTHAKHGAMTEAAGANSAAYLRIANRSDEDILLVAAASAAAAAVEFHETRIVDGVASMTRLESLLVPSQGELELAPGGAHLMLLNLTAELQMNDELVLELTSSAGEQYPLDFRVSHPPASDLADSVALGELVFNNRWARPASAG